MMRGGCEEGATCGKGGKGSNSDKGRAARDLWSDSGVVWFRMECMPVLWTLCGNLNERGRGNENEDGKNMLCAQRKCKLWTRRNAWCMQWCVPSWGGLCV